MWQRTLVRAVLGHRWLTLGAIALVSTLAAGFAGRATLDTSVEVWFLDNDPTLISYQEFKDRFGADRIGVVAVLADDVFEPSVLARIDRITQALEEAPVVNRVISVTNARVAQSVDGGVEIRDLVGELPEDPALADRLGREAAAHPLLVGSLVSAERNAAAIVAELTPEGNRPEGQRAFVQAAEAVIAAERIPGVTIHAAGSPFLAEQMIRNNARDSALFGPIGLGLVLLVGFLVFRRISAALIPLPVVIVATLWTFGVMGASGIPLTIISPMLFMLIVAVGVADTVHVLADYYRHLAAGASPEEAVEESVTHLLLPCFYTSATTAGGLLALRISDLGPLAEFGTFAAIGVTFAFVLSVTLVPIILHFAKPPDPKFVARQAEGPLARSLEYLGNRDASASRRTLAVAAVAIVVCGLQAMRIEVVANPMNFFKESDPMRQATHAIDATIGGTTSLEMLVETEEGGLVEPEILARLDDFERWLESRQGVTRTLAPTDLLRDLDRVMREREHGEVPDNRALAAQYYLLLEGEDDFDRLVQSNYAVGRITARANLSEADTVIRELEGVDAEIARRFPEGSGVSVEPTGFIRLVTKMDLYLIRSQIQSLALAVVVITTLMCLLLRSPALGFYSMIPNLLPIVFGVAFMATVGIHLDQGTVMIPPIALGLVVDDSVHFLYRYRSYVGAGMDVDEAIRRTVTETGRPILVTSLILASGFGAMITGSFNPAVYFGAISSLVILAALGATLFLLPAALRVFRPTVA